MAGAAVISCLRYKDARAAIDWLVRALGFTVQAVYDGPGGTVAHAQLTLGGGMVMLGSASNAGGEMAGLLGEPDDLGGKNTQTIYLVVEDATAAFERVKAVGPRVIYELQEMDYGGKAFGCVDGEGFVWSVGEYDPW